MLRRSPFRNVTHVFCVVFEVSSRKCPAFVLWEQTQLKTTDEAELAHAAAASTSVDENIDEETSQTVRYFPKLIGLIPEQDRCSDFVNDMHSFPLRFFLWAVHRCVIVYCRVPDHAHDFQGADGHLTPAEVGTVPAPAHGSLSSKAVEVRLCPVSPRRTRLISRWVP